MNINQVVSTILSKDLLECTEDQLRSELKVFIINNGGEDLLIDDEIETLCELANVYTSTPISDIEISINNHIEGRENVVYERIGPILRTNDSSSTLVMKKIGKYICDTHLDLHFILKKEGICFLDKVNVVFSFERVRQIKDMPHEYSGELILNRVKSEDQLINVIDPKYHSQKDWHFFGKHNRCRGKYFTITELIEATLNRKIITFDPYENIS